MYWQYLSNWVFLFLGFGGVGWSQIWLYTELSLGSESVIIPDGAQGAGDRIKVSHVQGKLSFFVYYPFYLSEIVKLFLSVCFGEL